jgi:hypothetical protein
MVDIPSGIQLITTGVRILMGEIRICAVQQVGKVEIGSMYHLVDDSIEVLCHSGHCDHHDWFMGCYQCRMPVRQCWLDLEQAAGHRFNLRSEYHSRS